MSQPNIQNNNQTNRGFPTRMVYLYYMPCLRYTILVGNPRNGQQKIRNTTKTKVKRANKQQTNQMFKTKKPAHIKLEEHVFKWLIHAILARLLCIHLSHIIHGHTCKRYDNWLVALCPSNLSGRDLLKQHKNAETGNHSALTPAQPVLALIPVLQGAWRYNNQSTKQTRDGLAMRWIPTPPHSKRMPMSSDSKGGRSRWSSLEGNASPQHLLIIAVIISSALVVATLYLFAARFEACQTVFVFIPWFPVIHKYQSLLLADNDGICKCQHWHGNYCLCCCCFF